MGIAAWDFTCPMGNLQIASRSRIITGSLAHGCIHLVTPARRHATRCVLRLLKGEEWISLGRLSQLGEN